MYVCRCCSIYVEDDMSNIISKATPVRASTLPCPRLVSAPAFGRKGQRLMHSLTPEHIGIGFRQSPDSHRGLRVRMHHVCPPTHHGLFPDEARHVGVVLELLVSSTHGSSCCVCAHASRAVLLQSPPQSLGPCSGHRLSSRSSWWRCIRARLHCVWRRRRRSR